jgi:hypothetical protein
LRRPWLSLVSAGIARGALSLNREHARALMPVVVGWLPTGWRSAPIRQRLTQAVALMPTTTIGSMRGVTARVPLAA